MEELTGQTAEEGLLGWNVLLLTFLLREIVHQFPHEDTIYGVCITYMYNTSIQLGLPIHSIGS